MYYNDKLDILRDIFGVSEVSLERGYLKVGGHTYPIVDDVIILLDPSQYPASLKKNVESTKTELSEQSSDFAEDIQFTFGEEWQEFPQILPEHEQEFRQYFDLVDIDGLKNSRVCDLGCGIGRWSYFLSDKCSELILVDFSEAIFVARRNLEHADNTLFFMGDLKVLPFRRDFADLLFCIGVLHHLPIPALEEIKTLNKYAPMLLIYLYYALDNRPHYFRIFFELVNTIRHRISKYRNPAFRTVFSSLATVIFYIPFIFLGTALRPFGISNRVPLYKFYHGKSLRRIRQDAYDRFFTSIEQRYTKKEIMELQEIFSEVIISEQLPYWHFICLS